MQSLALAKMAALMISAISGVTGSGKIKEETRNVGDFHAVRVEHGFKANIAIGPKTSVTVSADDNLLPLIRTEVRESWLTVGPTERDFRTSGEIRINIVTPQLSALSASGGSSITADQITGPTFGAQASGGSHIGGKSVNADELAAKVSGGGTLRLSGKVKRLRLEMSGGAEVNTEDLQAAAVQIHGSGGAHADVSATEELGAHLSGGSRVRVKGDPPKKSIEKSGGSEVRFQAS